jgi:hypothetical protein
MTQPAGADLYKRDFYAWTQEQARRVRALSGDNRFDAANVAEELADLGIQQRNAVESHLAQALAHLIKLAWIGDPDLYPKWAEEVDRHQDEACHTHTAAMKHDLDLDRIWRRAVRRANKSFRHHDEPELPRTPACPFTLDELLSEAFDTDAAIAQVSGALGVTPE